MWPNRVWRDWLFARYRTCCEPTRSDKVPYVFAKKTVGSGLVYWPVVSYVGRRRLGSQCIMSLMMKENTQENCIQREENLAGVLLCLYFGIWCLYKTYLHNNKIDKVKYSARQYEIHKLYRHGLSRVNLDIATRKLRFLARKLKPAVAKT